MKRIFLENLFKDLEIEDSVKKPIIDSIMTENGNDINAERIKTETAKNDLKVKEGFIEELNTKLKEAGNVDVEAIKKTAREEGFAEGSKEMDEFKKTNALKAAIKGARDFDLVCSKLDKEKIKYEKNEKGEYIVSGVDEQLKDIKENYSYLFDDSSTSNNDDGFKVDLGGEHKKLTEADSLNELKAAMGIEDEK